MGAGRIKGDVPVEETVGADTCSPTVGVRDLGRNLENRDELSVFQIVLTQSICSRFV